MKIKKYNFVQELLVQKNEEGGDAELEKFVDDIIKSKKSTELVKLMDPMDIASVFIKDYSLCPRDAAKAIIKIYQKIEGMPWSGIETNKEYPVPSVLKKNKNESALGRPDSKIDVTPKYVLSPGEQMPPTKQVGDEDWPYGDMTRAVMDPKNKGRKRGITSSKKPILKKKYVFKQDLATGQPGGDGAGGMGIYQTSRDGDGSMPGRGGPGSTRGVAGWSRSPADKEFDLPNEELDEQIIYEIGEEDIEKIQDYVSGIKPLSFDKLFKGKKRIPIEFKGGLKPELKELIAVKRFLKRNDYNVDIDRGTASRRYVIPAGPKKGQESVKEEKISNLLKKAIDLTNAGFKTIDVVTSAKKGSKEYNSAVKNLYRASDNMKKNFPSDAEKWPSKDLVPYLTKALEAWDKFTKQSTEKIAIISRHPIDVLRMSDFKNIQSCHSKGGQYYQCAVGEARGQGLVAYVVNKKDVPDNFDFQKDEIFADKERGVKGLKPVARIRLRKFVGKSGEEYAVPEEKVYGSDITGLVDAIDGWAKENQDIEKLKKEKSVARHGGSYGDTYDDDLIDNFIGSNFEGKVEREVSTDQEREETQEDRYIRECEEVNERYNYKHSFVHFEVDGEDEDVVVFFNGRTIIRVEDITDNKDEQDKILEIDERELSDIPVSDDVDEIVISSPFGRAGPGFMLEHSVYDFHRTPDGYEDFNQYVYEEFDQKYDEIVEQFKEFFKKRGLIGGDDSAIEKDIVVSVFPEFKNAVHSDLIKKYPDYNNYVDVSSLIFDQKLNKLKIPIYGTEKAVVVDVFGDSTRANLGNLYRKIKLSKPNVDNKKAEEITIEIFFYIIRIALQKMFSQLKKEGIDSVFFDDFSLFSDLADFNAQHKIPEMLNQYFRNPTGQNKGVKMEPVTKQEKNYWNTYTDVNPKAKINLQSVREQKIKKYVFNSYDPTKELNIEKDAPVGSAVPNFGFDVKTPDRRLGYRRK